MKPLPRLHSILALAGLLATLVAPRLADAQAPNRFRITGKVSDRDGQPIGNAWVTTRGSRRSGTLTSSSGRYVLDVQGSTEGELARYPLLIRVQAKHRGWKLTAPGGDTELAFEISIVADDKGNPILRVRSNESSVAKLFADEALLGNGARVGLDLDFVGERGDDSGDQVVDMAALVEVPIHGEAGDLPKRLAKSTPVNHAEPLVSATAAATAAVLPSTGAPPTTSSFAAPNGAANATPSNATVTPTSVAPATVATPTATSASVGAPSPAVPSATAVTPTASTTPWGTTPVSELFQNAPDDSHAKVIANGTPATTPPTSTLSATLTAATTATVAATTTNPTATSAPVTTTTTAAPTTAATPPTSAATTTTSPPATSAPATTTTTVATTTSATTDIATTPAATSAATVAPVMTAPAPTASSTTGANAATLPPDFVPSLPLTAFPAGTAAAATTPANAAPSTAAATNAPSGVAGNTAPATSSTTASALPSAPVSTLPTATAVAVTPPISTPAAPNASAPAAPAADAPARETAMSFVAPTLGTETPAVPGDANASGDAPKKKHIARVVVRPAVAANDAATQSQVTPPNDDKPQLVRPGDPQAQAADAQKRMNKMPHARRANPDEIRSALQLLGESSPADAAASSRREPSAVALVAGSSLVPDVPAKDAPANPTAANPTAASPMPPASAFSTSAPITTPTATTTTDPAAPAASPPATARPSSPSPWSSNPAPGKSPRATRMNAPSADAGSDASKPAGSDSCLCRIEGTVEVDSDQPLPARVPVLVYLEDSRKVADSVELFMGSPRQFNLRNVPCGVHTIKVKTLSKLKFQLTTADPVIDCSGGGYRQVRIVLEPQSKKSQPLSSR